MGGFTLGLLGLVVLAACEAYLVRPTSSDYPEDYGQDVAEGLEDVQDSLRPYLPPGGGSYHPQPREDTPYVELLAKSPRRPPVDWAGHYPDFYPPGGWERPTSPPQPRCVRDYRRCDDNHECCSNLCYVGECIPATCAKDGELCIAHDQCCSQLCSWMRCTYKRPNGRPSSKSLRRPYW